MLAPWSFCQLRHRFLKPLAFNIGVMAEQKVSTSIVSCSLTIRLSDARPQRRRSQALYRHRRPPCFPTEPARTAERKARGVAGGLNQLLPLHARVPVLADDDVIVHGDAERTGDVDARL